MTELQMKRAIRTDVKKHITHHKRELRKLEDINNMDIIIIDKFTVNIHNAWHYEGGHHAIGSGKNLRQTFDRVVKNFFKLNRRSDIQGVISIYACVGNHYRYRVFRGNEDEVYKFMEDYK